MSPLEEINAKKHAERLSRNTKRGKYLSQALRIRRAEGPEARSRYVLKVGRVRRKLQARVRAEDAGKKTLGERVVAVLENIDRMLTD